MGDACLGAGEEADLGLIELDAVGMPDVVAAPAEVFGVLAGPYTELFE